MAELLTRTYTYKGQSNWKAGVSSVPLSSFSVSGDDRPISQIVSIEASHYRWQDTSSTITYTARLIFSNGAATVESATTSLRDDGVVWKPVNSFLTGLPSASDFTPENVTIETSFTPTSKLDDVRWMATSERPMTLVVTYYSSEFKPSISSVKMYRSNSSGGSQINGTYVTFTASLGLESIGTSGKARIDIYEGDTKNTASETLVYSKTDISPSANGMSVSIAPIPSYTLPITEMKWYSIRFSYTATTESGAVSTEESTAILVVNTVFTNVHLSGMSTGGVSLGAYSTSTEGNPKLESHYPIYALEGINGVNIYSTEEVKTGGRWINDKPTYKRTFIVECPAISGGSYKTASIISDSDEIVEYNGCVYRDSSAKNFPLDFYAASNNNHHMQIDNGGVLYYISTSACVFRFTVVYTKSTD